MTKEISKVEQKEVLTRLSEIANVMVAKGGCYLNIDGIEVEMRLHFKHVEEGSNDVIVVIGIGILSYGGFDQTMVRNFLQYLSNRLYPFVNNGLESMWA